MNTNVYTMYTHRDTHVYTMYTHEDTHVYTMYTHRDTHIERHIHCKVYMDTRRMQAYVNRNTIE